MRVTLVLVLSCVAAAALPLACGGAGDSVFNPGGDSDGAVSGDGGDPAFGDSSIGGDGQTGGQIQNLASMRISPADAVISVAAGAVATQGYKVFGTMKSGGPEVDITARSVFYVPDNYLVGGFPTTGAPLFSTRLPAVVTDPPQRGGRLTVQAQAANSDGTTSTATTSLTVSLAATLNFPGGSAIPANPGSLFSGTADPTRAPVLSYPNNNAFLPPNLKRLEVHWKPGSASNTLYEISFKSSLATITYFSRCNTVSSGSLKAGACGFELDSLGYAYLAESNRGAGNVAIKIRGTDDAGSAFGESAVFNVQFGESNVEGGIYYWDVTDTQIMRYDFGGAQAAPEVFIAGNDYGLPTASNGNCVGCHAISRDGTKIVASIGGQNNGLLVYQADLSKAPTPPLPARTDPAYLTKVGASGLGTSGNEIQFATFNPLGTAFAAVYGETTTPDRNKLWMHDGTTGDRIGSVLLAFEPDHPDWSPDGKMIAVTHVNGHNTSQQAFKGGIDVLTSTSGSTFTTASTTATTVVPFVSGKNRFNPNFVPDSSFMLFTEATCPSDNCNTDVVGATAATTWAVKPAAAAIPIHLANAALAGVTDGAPTNFRDTFPRATPFQSKQGSGKLFWFTVASRREPGERAKTGANQQLLWMFAIDPVKVMAGLDGSYPGFFLPFQDLQTSNHIGQWTEKIVTSAPPPAPPPPPPPPPPVK